MKAYYYYPRPSNGRRGFWLELYACRAPGLNKCQHLHASLKHLEVVYSESENSARILRIQGVWHFFQIRHISLLRAPIWNTKWIVVHALMHSAWPKEVNTPCAPIWSSLSGISQIWTKCQNLEILRNLALFHIGKIPLLSTQNCQVKCGHF